tara:strand:+ start:6563 stop:7678 length:1116 start_codon:yes stop_codon:yes gene_type:complete
MIAENLKPMKEIPSNIKMVLKEAKDLIEKGGAESAEQARAKLLDVSEASEYPIYHMMLAKVAKELNQKDTALAHLEKSLEFDKPSIQAILRVSESRIKDGNIIEGFDLLMKGKALVLEEGNAKYGCRVATLLIKAGYADEAIDILNQLQKLNPNDREVSYTLGLAHRQKGSSEQYEAEALRGIQKSEVKHTLKQRVQLAKHYMMENSYGKALGLLAPIKDLDDEQFSDDKIREIVAIMTAICYVEVNSADIAKELIVSVKNQSGIGANYVWCKIQFEEEEYNTAAKTASAIKLLAERLLGKMDRQKKKADGLLNNPSSSIKDSQRKRLESAMTSEAQGIQQITQASIDPTKESLNQFLQIVHTVWLNTLPG